jgi:hypothetical protein
MRAINGEKDLLLEWMQSQKIRDKTNDPNIDSSKKSHFSNITEKYL